MNDFSEARFRAAEAEAHGYIVVQPFAYIMLRCPTCFGLVEQECWMKHTQFHNPFAFPEKIVGIVLGGEERT